MQAACAAHHRKRGLHNAHIFLPRSSLIDHNCLNQSEREMDKMQAPYAQYELQPANRLPVRRQLSSPTESAANSDVLITPRYKRARSGGGTFRWPDILKATIGSLLFATALSLTVLSKLSVISMTSRLKVNETDWEEVSGRREAVALYWQLLLVMVLPNVFTLLRTLLLGMCGKQTANFPWPTKKAIFVVSFDECISEKF